MLWGNVDMWKDGLVYPMSEYTGEKRFTWFGYGKNGRNKRGLSREQCNT